MTGLDDLKHCSGQGCASYQKRVARSIQSGTTMQLQCSMVHRSLQGTAPRLTTLAFTSASRRQLQLWRQPWKRCGNPPFPPLGNANENDEELARNKTSTSCGIKKFHMHV